MPQVSILQSIKLDTAQSWFGFPYCAQGKQPRFHEVVSETAKISSESIQQVLEQLNQIFHVSCIVLYWNTK